MSILNRWKYRFLRYPRKNVAILVVFLLLALGLFFAFSTEEKEKSKKITLPTVSIIIPGKTPVKQFIRAIGSINAYSDIPVSLQGDGGRVVALLVESGDLVRKGQILARLDTRLVLAQREQAKATQAQMSASADLARIQLTRGLSLFKEKFISKSQVDTLTSDRDSNQARFLLAQAQVKELQVRLDRMEIRAPVAGLLLKRNIQLGETIFNKEKILFRLAENDMFEATLSIAEQDMPFLKVGQIGHLHPVGNKKDITGKIWLLEPSIDPKTRLGIARLLLPKHLSLYTGLFTKAKILIQEKTVPVLPKTAIQADEKGVFVYVLDKDNRIVRKPVQISRFSDENSVVESGLTGKERIVLLAGAFLRPGDQVTPSLHTIDTKRQNTPRLVEADKDA